MLSGVSADITAPIILFTYYNPIMARGLEQYCADIRAAGASGLLVPDIPLEETDGIRAALNAEGLELVLLPTPTTRAPPLPSVPNPHACAAPADRIARIVLQSFQTCPMSHSMHSTPPWSSTGKARPTSAARARRPALPLAAADELGVATLVAASICPRFTPAPALLTCDPRPPVATTAPAACVTVGAPQGVLRRLRP